MEEITEQEINKIKIHLLDLAILKGLSYLRVDLEPIPDKTDADITFYFEEDFSTEI